MSRIKRIISLLLVVILSMGLWNIHVFASDYGDWKQWDSEWGDVRLGNSAGTRMAKIGCRVTSIAIVCARLGLVDKNFTPGTFANDLKNIGAFTNGGAMYNWTDPEKVVNGLKMVQKVDLSGMSISEKAKVISKYTTNGYACTICVKSGGHYVAGDYVSGDTVYIYDPGYNNRKKLFDYYNNSGITSIRVFKRIDGAVGNTNSQTTPKPVATPKPTPKPTATPKPSCNHSYNKSGYCSKCSKEYSISSSSMSGTYEAVKNDVPVRNRPYSPDKIIKYLSKGTKVTVVASGKNSIGNLWYKLNDGTWIYSENLKKSSLSSNTPKPTQKPSAQSTSIRFELESVPKGNLPYGKSFSLKGWFRSDCAIVEARAYMLDENKNIVMQSDKASSTTSNYKIQGYKLDKAMKFNKLSPGGYYLKYFVRDANGDTATWISDKFYIVK